MTKIEEVARAMCRRAVSTWPESAREGRTVEEIVDWDWREWVEDACAAIEAMRVPNEAMIESSYKAGEMKSCNSPEEAKALFRDVLWPAAVDAILKEKPE